MKFVYAYIPSGLIHLGTCLLAMLVILSCGTNEAVNYPGDTTKSGEITISVDESFKPIIDSQIKVFESSYPDAKIITQYKPEAECLKDLNNDSIRMVIVTRALTSGEEKKK